MKTGHGTKRSLLETPPQIHEAVSQFVIPAKPRETGHEPGSRKKQPDDLYGLRCLPWTPIRIHWSEGCLEIL